MKSWKPVFVFVAIALLTACGGKKKDATTPDKEATTEESKGDERAGEAEKKIRTWLSTDLAKKMSEMGKAIGKDVGVKLAKNPEVISKAKALSGAIFKDGAVKPKLKAIEDRATAGFGKKLSLGWKAIKSGGLDNFKKKVAADAQRVAMEVMSVYLKENLLKDERTAALLKEFTPVLKLQGQMAALALQENLSPKATKKIVGIALRLSSTGANPDMADSVDAWIKECESDVDSKMETLVAQVGNLESLQTAAAGVAVDVLAHPRTKKELADLAVRLVDDKAVNQALTKVYEAAAFEKGDAAIRQAMEGVLAIDTVDRELFTTLERLSSAPGAGAIIGKHLNTVTEDPKLAAIVEDFVISVLETCGDPS